MSSLINKLKNAFARDGLYRGKTFKVKFSQTPTLHQSTSPIPSLQKDLINSFYIAKTGDTDFRITEAIYPPEANIERIAEKLFEAELEDNAKRNNRTVLQRQQVTKDPFKYVYYFQEEDNQTKERTTGYVIIHNNVFYWIAVFPYTNERLQDLEEFIDSFQIID